MCIRDRGQDVEVEITVPFHVGVEGGEHGITIKASGQAERLTVKIPPGMKNGGKVRLAGQGQPSRTGGPPGDVIAIVNISAHPWFRRDGSTLLVDIPVSVTEATLGGKVDVPTLTEGLVVMSIPPGTASGSKLRLRGKGVPNARTGERGDQLAVVKIIPPKDLSPEAEAALKTFEELAPQSPREGKWGT